MFGDSDYADFLIDFLKSGKPPPCMASCNLDRGFLMVVGDSVLGLKGKTKVFADNALGEIFELGTTARGTHTPGGQRIRKSV